MKGFILLITSLLVGSSLNAQTQGIAYPAVGKGAATTFVTDYHSLGINSSSLGWGTGYDKKHFTIGTSEFGFGIYSDSLNVDKLRKLYGAVKNEVTGDGNNSDTWSEQRQYGKEYANAGVAITANYNWLGFSYQNEKLGGIAFSVNENYSWFSRISEQTSDILFNGKFSNYFDTLTVVFGSDTSRIANYDGISQDTLQNVIAGTISTPLLISEITKGTEIKARWNRYYNFGYGRKLFGKDSVFVVYGGIGGRFIQSTAMFDFESNESGLRMYSSVSPSFDINYSAQDMNAASFQGTNQKGFPKSVGNGYGFDLSISAKIFDKITVAAAVNNIGQVTYKRNVYSLKDTIVGRYSLDGLGSYNVTQALNNLLEEGGLLQLEGEEDYVVKNAADFRFGASWKMNKFINVGFDVVAPFDRTSPGSIANPVYAFGGEIRPVKWIAISAGYFGGGIYKNNIPMGINFIVGNGSYEFGISSRDMLSFVMNDSNSVSTALGFMRFRF